MAMTDLKTAALTYHAEPRPGKLSVGLSKPASSARELSLAWCPGVAEPVREIARDPQQVFRYTGKGNLVAVISDGSAILGLGNLGPLASKPVMEGKGVLFKRFAGIDVYDIEIDAESPQAFIDTVRRIAVTFGAINLEDIKAPECFEIERVLASQCGIPVFHDDQHGAAIVTAAGLLNALELAGKALETVRIVCLGAGAAAISCMRLVAALGARPENILMLDRKGVIHSGRADLNPYKAMFAHETECRTLSEAMEGADVFIGLSDGNLLGAEDLRRMAPRPIVFACSNPDPEISPELAHATRDDLILATGRADYPNQINNVLASPFVFRGALDVRATRINEEMKIAACRALCELARQPLPEEAGAGAAVFGRDYILPRLTDPRLIGVVSAAVARAAIDSGVATQPWPAHYPLGSLADIFSQP